MYKVFFKESVFLLTDHTSDFKKGSLQHYFTSSSELKKFVYGILAFASPFEVFIYHNDMEELFSIFKGLFSWRDAAGGVVWESGNILFIRRNGFYDLPKGHLEKGESPQEGAIREVKEECGLQELNISSVLSATYHIYVQQEEYILKKTHWFAMTCPPNQLLIPQKEEGIEEVFWIDREDIPGILNRTYSSLKELLQDFLILHDK